MHHLPLHLVPKYESDPYEYGDAFAVNSRRVALADEGCDEPVHRSLLRSSEGGQT